MAKKQRFMTAGATIAVVALTAHVMQQGATRDPSAPGTPVSSAAIAAPAIQSTEPMVVVSEAVQTDDTSAFEELTQATVVVSPTALSPAEAKLQDKLAMVVTPDPMVPNGVVPAAIEVTPGRLAELSDVEDLPGNPTPLGFPAPPRDMVEPSPFPTLGQGLNERLQEVRDLPVADTTEDEPRSQFGMACGPVMSTATLPGGLVNVIMVAPCRPNTRFELGHGPISFSGQTDQLGSYEVTIPALAQEAFFAVRFVDGETVTSEANVRGVLGLDRVAVMAPGEAGFQIHALEFGAQYGEAGHIWAENPGSPDLAATEGSGYLMRLGDEDLPSPTVAEVYTFPRSTSGETGMVRLSVETEVTALNCGTEAAGQTIELGPDGVASAVGVSVEVPDCNAIGEFLVLKNVLRDLRIASSN